MTTLHCPECRKAMASMEVGVADREKNVLIWGCECGFAPSFKENDPWALCTGCFRYFPPSDNLPYQCPTCNKTFQKFGQEVEI